jgi:hypothetical protein
MIFPTENNQPHSLEWPLLVWRWSQHRADAEPHAAE